MCLIEVLQIPYFCLLLSLFLIPLLKALDSYKSHLNTNPTKVLDPCGDISQIFAKTLKQISDNQVFN